MSPIDELQLNFNPTGLLILNIVLGVIMFGIALDLKWADFSRIIRNPKGPFVGILAQFLLLPAVTFALILLLKPTASIALGMMLIAACPGGNISNFMTHLAHANTGLSVSMTGISTAASVIMTPLNVAFWSSLHPETAQLYREINVQPQEMLKVVFLILGLPLTLGVYTNYKYPAIAQKLKQPFKYASILFFLVFVIAAFAANWQNFLNYINYAAVAVLLHNAIAFGSGYLIARLTRLPQYESRAVALEVGIQNSGLGLVLIFNFFNGLGGMALVAAAWGIWHIIAGFALSFYWSRKPAY